MPVGTAHHMTEAPSTFRPRSACGRTLRRRRAGSRHAVSQARDCAPLQNCTGVSLRWCGRHTFRKPHHLTDVPRYSSHLRRTAPVGYRICPASEGQYRNEQPRGAGSDPGRIAACLHTPSRVGRQRAALSWVRSNLYTHGSRGPCFHVILSPSNPQKIAR